MPEEEVPAPKTKLPSWHHFCKALQAESYLGPEVDNCPDCGTLKVLSKRKPKKTEEEDDG